MTSTYETLEPDGYLQPRRYKITAICNRCGGEFSWTARSPGGKDRPCPKSACKQAAHDEEVMAAAEKLAVMLAERRAPGVIGANTQVKAVDATAEIVMQDYGLTDLKDNLRQGDAVAPKLDPRRQNMADNYFGGGALSNNRARQAAVRVARKAIAGGMGPSPIDPGRLAGGVSALPGQAILRRVETPNVAKPVTRMLGRG